MSKKFPDTDFIVFLAPFRVIWDFFDTFGQEAWEHHFESGPESLATPVYGGSHRNACVYNAPSLHIVERNSMYHLSGTGTGNGKRQKRLWHHHMPETFKSAFRNCGR